MSKIIDAQHGIMEGPNACDNVDKEKAREILPAKPGRTAC